MFFTDPEQMLAYIRAQEIRAEMTRQDVTNRIAAMFDELDPEHLQTVQLMLATLVGPDGHKGIWYLLGFISSTMRARGIDSLENAPTPAGADSGQPEESSVDPASEVDPNWLDRLGDSVGIQEEQDSDAPDYIQQIYKEYNVIPLTDIPTDKCVKCLGCSTLYSSLDDRMLRSPGIDGCSGCQRRSGHG